MILSVILVTHSFPPDIRIASSSTPLSLSSPLIALSSLGQPFFCPCSCPIAGAIPTPDVLYALHSSTIALQ